METGTIAWLFKLIDGVSPPAKNVTKAVNDMTKATQETEKAAKSAGSSWTSMLSGLGRSAGAAASDVGQAFSGLGESFHRLINLPNLAMGAFAAWGGKLVIEAQGWRQSTLDTLDLLLGGQKQAAEVMNEIGALSQRTSLPMNVLSEQMTEFLRSGKVTVGEAEVMVRALADVYATRGFKPEVFQQGAEAMTYMANSTRLTARAMMQVRAAQVNPSVWLAQLSKLRGETPRMTQFMIAAGRVSGKQGAQALVNAIQEEYDRGKPIGSAFARESKTLPGALARLRTDFSNFWGRMDLSKALGPFTKIVDAIATILENPKMVKAAQDIAGQIFAALFGPAAGKITPESIMGFLQKLPQYAKEAHDAIAGFIAGIRDAIGVLEGVARALKPVIDLMAKLFPATKGKGGASTGAQIAGFALTLGYAFKILSPVVKPLAGAFLQLIPVLFRLGLAFYAALGPIGLIVLALAGLAILVIKYQDQIQGAWDSMIGAATRWLDGIQAAWDNAAAASGKWVADQITAVANWLNQIQSSFDTAAASAGSWVSDTLSAAWNEFLKWGEQAVEWFSNLGGNLINALTGGITKAVGSMGDALSGAWNFLKGMTQQALGVHSPSTVFRRYGQDLMSGFAQGLGVRPPEVPLPGAPSATAPTGVGGRAVPSATLSVVINIDGAQSPTATGSAVRDSVSSVLGQWFDLFAQETGGAPLASTPTG